MAQRRDAQSATLKRSIRTIQSELEFLADSDLLSQDQLSSILAQLPSSSTLKPATSTHQAPTEAFNNLNVSSTNEKQDYYAPSPQPEKQQPASNNTSHLPPPPAYPAAPSPQPQVSALTHVTALYAYSPTEAHDLALVAGDRVAVTEYMNSEWWKGRSERTGAEGIFPRNYVRMDDQPPARSNGTNYGNMPVDVSNSGGGSSDPGRVQSPSKGQEYGKKFGKKMGNAAIFGAGATVGSNIVNSIF